MRHLDRVAGIDSLSAKGLDRAQRLARWFQDRSLSSVLSLRLARTVRTAEPTAEARGLALETFGSTDALVAALKTAPTPALAVVHGASVPVVLAALTKRSLGERVGFGFGRIWIVDCEKRTRVVKPFEDSVVGRPSGSERNP